MRIGLLIIASIFAIALLTGEPDKATAQSCHGASCAAVSGCAGASSVGCAGEARRPVRGLAKRVLGIRPLKRLRGCI